MGLILDYEKPWPNNSPEPTPVGQRDEEIFLTGAGEELGCIYPGKVFRNQKKL